MKTLVPLVKLMCFILCLTTLTTSCGSNGKAVVKKMQVNDIELAYYTRGSGEPLIMIMGFRGTMGVWDTRLLEELEKNYTLILFDNRGVGFSTDTKEDLTTISQMAEDTSGLIKALGYDKVHVLGWSMGSRIAMQLAVSHPEIVKTLILCSPNPGGKYQAKREGDAYLLLTNVHISNEEALPLIYPQTTQGYLAAAEFIAHLTGAIILGTVPSDLEVSSQTIERQVRALRRWDQNDEHYEALAHIKVPTLVTGGLEDILDNPENARTVANRIPFAWSAYFQGAGHAFLSQDYEEFSRLVHVFTESQK